MSAPREVLLVDDEAHARKHLRRLLSARADFVVAGEADSVAAAAAWCAQRRPALVLLDVQMPVEDGFALLPRLPEPPPEVIFVTAHDAFAVRAFEVNALDYLLKPVTEKRLALALGRLGAAAEAAVEMATTVEAVASPALPESPPLHEDDVVLLRDGARRRFVPVRAITAIEADGNFSRVHLGDDAPFHLLRALGEWEKILPAAAGFIRVDRSLLVNVRGVAEFRTESRDTVRLRLRGVADPFTLGRTAAVRLRAALREQG